MKKIPLHIRIAGLPSDKWVTLDEACKIVGTSAKTHLKMHLLLSPQIEWRKVEVSEANYMQLPDIWRWEFRRIEDIP